MTPLERDAERRAFYDGLYAEHDPALALEFDNPSACARWLAEELEYDSDVLDIGGGSGVTAVWMAGLGFRVTLVDESPRGVERAKELARTEEVSDRVTAIRQDVRTGLPQGQFGAVMMLRVLHDLEYDEAVAIMAAARAATKPGGYHAIELCLYGSTDIPELADHFVPPDAQTLIDIYLDAGWESVSADETMCCVHPILSAIFRRPYF